MRVLPLLLIFTSSLLTADMVLPAMAQVISDGTTNTLIETKGNDFRILNGIEQGNNLFHSFREFSIPTGNLATFVLSNPNITNIFSRVTGGNVSTINGTIQTLGGNSAVNLFFMNPAGIVFGKDAKLNISGSFVGTTANSIKFADGTEFSVANSQVPPLLTMSVPIGLQMGSNPASITVQGTGHSLTNLTGQPPIKVNPSATQLRLIPGKTLALVGGNLELDGATLNAKQGQLELGSLDGAGFVSLIPIAKGYTLAYEHGQSFADIYLSQKSLLDVSGINAGGVQIQGRQIKFSDGSLILAQNFGNLPGGNIQLQASAAIDMIGIDAKGIRSGIRTETFGKGASGSISISTPKLTVQKGAGLNSVSLGGSTSGNIQIDAGTIEISGFSTVNSRGVSSVGSSTYGSGNAGDILVNGNSLLVSGGASLSSTTFGKGSSGQVIIHNNFTTVMGENPLGLYSNISSTTLATGNAKTLVLDTAKLQIMDGGVVAATTFFKGNGGDLQINARESIEISGRSRTNNSSINSSTLRLTPQLRQLFNLPNVLTANAGNISITTPSLILTDGGAVSVTSQGTGNGGNLHITANTIHIDRQATIQAQTESGNGGNITLEVAKLLLLRHNSAIAATAGGNGNGGNININAPVIAGLENSDIIANAVRGKGGNIQITTEGMIGLQFRPQLTPENDITASSQFGISGHVQINNLGLDPNSGLVELPSSVTDPSQQIATGCSADQGSSFVATGRGGIPENPIQEVSSDRPWSDIRDISAFHTTQPLQGQISPVTETLVQASSWHRNSQGKIELVADQSPAQVQAPLTCAFSN